MPKLNVLKRLSSAQYPPRVFECKLEPMLNEKFGKEHWSVNQVAACIGITHITMKSILAGGTVKLENAMKLAELVGASVVDIWKLRS